MSISAAFTRQNGPRFGHSTGSQGRLNFTALQHRLRAGPKTLRGWVAVTPASYAVFDVVATAGHDARDLPLSDRRALLEELVGSWEPPLSPTQR